MRKFIDDEVFGTLRNMSVDDMEGIDPDGLYLTQSRSMAVGCMPTSVASRMWR